MAAHTPGPWHAAALRTQGDPTRQGCDIGAENNANVAIVLHDAIDRDAVETIANARLIAAAPDLLQACQTFAEWLRREEAGGEGQPWSGERDTPGGENQWREWYYENLRICDLAQTQVRAAIAKATL